VLNRALKSATAVDGDSLAAALGGIGTVDDSPRGPWTFDGQNPRQTMYLRKVENSGGTLVNAVVEDLGQQSQTS
jgi:branched-chain amino acid transport system substrate-binding protein